MRNIRNLFWLLTIVIVITAAAYFYAKQSSSLLAESLRPHTSRLTPVVETIVPHATSIKIPIANLEEVTALTQRGKDLTNHVGTVLGETISEADPEKQPLHQRAIEYGQYLYCKGIVEEYEKNHDTSKPSEEDVRSNL